MIGVATGSLYSSSVFTSSLFCYFTCSLSRCWSLSKCGLPSLYVYIVSLSPESIYCCFTCCMLLHMLHWKASISRSNPFFSSYPSSPPVFLFSFTTLGRSSWRNSRKQELTSSSIAFSRLWLMTLSPAVSRNRMPSSGDRVSCSWLIALKNTFVRMSLCQ